MVGFLSVRHVFVIQMLRLSLQKRAERREKRDEHANSQSDRDTEDLDS